MIGRHTSGLTLWFLTAIRAAGAKDLGQFRFCFEGAISTTRRCSPGRNSEKNLPLAEGQREKPLWGITGHSTDISRVGHRGSRRVVDHCSEEFRKGSGLSRSAPMTELRFYVADAIEASRVRRSRCPPIAFVSPGRWENWKIRDPDVAAALGIPVGAGMVGDDSGDYAGLARDAASMGLHIGRARRYLQPDTVPHLMSTSDNIGGGETKIAGALIIFISGRPTGGFGRALPCAPSRAFGGGCFAVRRMTVGDGCVLSGHLLLIDPKTKLCRAILQAQMPSQGE